MRLNYYRLNVAHFASEGASYGVMGNVRWNSGMLIFYLQKTRWLGSLDGKNGESNGRWNGVYFYKLM